VDLLLFSLGAMVEALKKEYRLEVDICEGVDHFGPKFQVEGDVPHQPFVHS